MEHFPSIFNDVIGPVMRGPSSSHTAASWRVGRMAVQLLGGKLSSALIEFDQQGAWVTNYREQGTVLGMDGGLLEIDMADDAMKQTEQIARERGVKIRYKISQFENQHPNSMQVTLFDVKGNSLSTLAASLGGGTFEIQKVDGFDVSMKGDYYNLMIWSTTDISFDLKMYLNPEIKLLKKENGAHYLFIIQKSTAFDPALSDQILSLNTVRKMVTLRPIMPIVSGREQELPFDDVESLILYSHEHKMNLGEMGVLYEQYRSGLSEDILYSQMKDLILIIENSIKTGLQGTDYQDRILPQQSHLIKNAEKGNKILAGSIVNRIVENVAAIMEAKSALEVIVANPTAGSCGTVGGVIAAVAEELGSSLEDKILAYFAAGIVGAYFALGPGFSAEEHGCQVECGASAGMAAAGIVQLFGGTVEAGLGAASMAIQNMIGLVCDPIADRVEAPCLGKNTSAAMNALSSATMAVAGFAHLIPLDQVLETVERVSTGMPTCVKCTGLGGLAITPAAMKLKAELDQLL